MRPFALLAVPIAALVVVTAGCAPGSSRSNLSDDPAERHRQLFEQAWGPEDPERLTAYLEAKAQIEPRFRQYEDALRQYSLREVSTQPLFGPAMLGANLLRRDLDTALEAHGLSFADYQRLTILIYGRWLRSVREEDPPEVRIVRVLQELELGLTRRLENNPPEGQDRAKLEARLASVSHQRLFLSPYATQDKEAVLARIDAGTRGWLEANRAKIEALDFDTFDTMAPPRTKPEKPGPPPGAPAGSPPDAPS